MSLTNETLDLGKLVIEGFGAGILLYCSCFAISKVVHYSKKFFNIITK